MQAALKKQHTPLVLLLTLLFLSPWTLCAQETSTAEVDRILGDLENDTAEETETGGDEDTGGNQVSETDDKVKQDHNQ